jgi:hypothetical protein
VRERDHGARSEGGTEGRGCSAHRAVVDDLSRTLHRQHRWWAMAQDVEGPSDPLQGPAGRCGVRPVPEANEDGLGTVDEVAKAPLGGWYERVRQHRSRPDLQMQRGARREIMCSFVGLRPAPRVHSEAPHA